MRTDETPLAAPRQPMAGDVREVMVCPSCEQEVPKGSLYCPYCCGADGRRGATKRGAFVGGVFGLLAGGLLTAVWSSVVGPEEATWGPVLSITLAATAAGMVVGAIGNRKG